MTQPAAQGPAERWPDVYLIGAMKSASTSLYRYLEQHPQLHCPHLKEPNFHAFSGVEPAHIPERTRYQSALTPNQYVGLFQTAASGQRLCDGSIHYLISDIARRSIARVAPDARFLAILRQPSDRAWSHFQFTRETGLEPVDDFRTALAQEPERRKRKPLDPSHAYLEIGFYERHLCAWQRHFERRQFCFVLFDDFAEHPQRELRRIFRFLEIDPDFEPDTSQRYTVTGVPRTKWLHRLLAHPKARWHMGNLLPPRIVSPLGRVLRRPAPSMPASIREQLNAQYRDDIKALQDRIGRDLGHWL